MSSAPSAVDAAAALIAAYGAKHAADPPRNAIVFPLAQMMGEGSLSSYFAGTNNFGAMHATKGFASKHAKDAGFGMVAFLDHGGQGAYIGRMAVYPSMLLGAIDYLALVERDVPIALVANESDYAAHLYAKGYFEGFSTPVTPIADRAAALAANTWNDADRANIAAYAALIARNVPAADAALLAAPSSSSSPAAVTVGPPFATLAERLTPSSQYAPHTLDHARALLGAAADSPPPGAISIDDALSSPTGDGVWFFASPAPARELAQSSSSSSGALDVAIGVALGLVLGAGAYAGARALQGRPVFA